MSTTAPEFIETISTGWADAMRTWFDQSQSMWDQSQAMWEQWGVPLAPATRSRTRHTHGRGRHDCGCQGDCCRDRCDCCLPDADVVVRMRVGERRLVPFRLHNHWRREREVSVAVGPWHACSGAELVVVAVPETEQVTLGPCEDRIVRVVIGAVAEPDKSGGGGDDGSGGDGTNESGETGIDDHVTQVGAFGRFGRDLDACASAYADVRFEGCARPQRVAVVVSPAECDSIDVGCDCGCCC